MPWPVDGRTPLGFLRSRSQVEMRQLWAARHGASQNRPLYGSNGHIHEASVKLDVPSFFIEQVLRNEPAPDHVLDRIERKGGPMQHHLIETAGLPESPTYQRGVYPSTVRELLEGLPISQATQRQLDISPEEDTTVRAPDHVKANRTSALTSTLREIVRSDVDMFDLASQWDMTETSLRKLYEGKPVSRFLTKKVEAALACARPTDQVAGPSAAIERLQRIHKLYKELGTLEAVGEQVGLTRERVRQLLVKGRGIGLFEYKPYEYPCISKDKLIGDYMYSSNLGYVAKINQISWNYLRKLLAAYSISKERLAECRTENRRARCIEQYTRLADKTGHHLTTTELQSTSEGRSLYNRIYKLWCTIDAFREAFNIPKPPRRAGHSAEAVTLCHSSIVIGHSSIEGWRAARSEETARTAYIHLVSRDAYLAHRFTLHKRPFT
jgi:hypothetical protein